MLGIRAVNIGQHVDGDNDDDDDDYDDDAAVDDDDGDEFYDDDNDDDDKRATQCLRHLCVAVARKCA